jgi:hypothetical protein
MVQAVNPTAEKGEANFFIGVRQAKGASYPTFNLESKGVEARASCYALVESVQCRNFF